MHPEREILAFDVRCGDATNVRHSGNNGAFNLHHFHRAIPGGSFLTEIGEGVGFYYLAVINLTAEPAFNRVRIGRQRIG